MDPLLFQVIEYEDKIFNEFITKRLKFANIIKKIEINKLDSNQLLIFINDTKAIIDPLITSMENMDYLFTNIEFKKDDSIKFLEEFQKMVTTHYFLLRNLPLGSDSSLDSESDSSLDSELEVV
jgi:hypothetical protein